MTGVLAGVSYCRLFFKQTALPDTASSTKIRPTQVYQANGLRQPFLQTDPPTEKEEVVGMVFFL